MPSIRIGKTSIGGGSSSSSWTPQYDALFDTRSGVTLIDSKAGEEITIKQFPVANYLTTAGAAYYVGFSADAPVTVTGDYTAILIARNEASDTLLSSAFLQDCNGNAKSGQVNCRSGALYNAGQIVSSSADLNFNDSGKVVTPAEPWVLSYVFDSATNTIKCFLNGTEIDSAVDATWALGLGVGQLGWKAMFSGTNVRIFGVWIIDRKLTAAELINITDNGIWPSITPSRQYVHLNYGDVVSDRTVGSHNRHIAQFGNNGSNLIPPDPATMWTKRYDNPIFAYPLFYGYTGWGVHKIPYSPASVKMMADPTGDIVGDIEFPASGVIHNMAESLIDFSGITDAEIKALFNKADRAYWKASIEDTDYYALGAYLWHPSQLIRTFVTTHAESGHENHIFAGLRKSGNTITGITKIGIFKTNLA